MKIAVIVVSLMGDVVCFSSITFYFKLFTPRKQQGH